MLHDASRWARFGRTMYLEQICPGQVNPGFHALTTFTWKAVRYIVYASGYKVILFADPAILVQQINVPLELSLENSSAATAVAGNTRTGQLAVACWEHVAIFKAEIDEKVDYCLWKLDDAIKLDTTANCLDWSENGSLLVAGHNISVWRPKEGSFPKFQKIWQIRPATDIIMAKFEPHSDMFITAGKNDHLVTLWYKQSADAKYSFLYLHHPKPVTYFVWRKLYGSQRPDCALFTMARDGIGRFWRPIDSEKPHMLHMCAVIDPSQSLVTADLSSSENGSAHIREHHSDDFTPIHYIGCDEIGSSIYTQFRHHSRNDKLDHRLHRVRDMIHDTPDLLFRIQPDGSLTLWGVQYLDMSPRRIPRVFVVLRVAQAIDTADIPFFLNPVNVLHDFGHIQSASIIKPAELSLITRNPEGQLRCYGLNLVDFLDTACFSPRLHFKYSWLGHKYPIKSVNRSQGGSLCTIGADGLVNLWKYGSVHNANQAWSRLDTICSLTSEQPPLLAIPLEQDKHVAIYDGNEMRVYHCEEGDCCMHDYIVCENGCSTFSSLHTFNIDTDDDKLYYLLAISSSTKQVYTWQLIIENDVVIRVEYRGLQQFDWADAPSSVFIADRWSSNTASTALYNLSYTSDDIVSATIAIGSKIICYDVRFQADDETLQWRELFTFDTEMDDIQKIRFMHNAFAIVSENKLLISSSIQSGHPPSMHKSVQFDSKIADIAWNLSSDGQYLLAVAFSRKVSIYGEKRDTNTAEDLNLWIPYIEFDVQSLEDIAGLCWIDYGVLAVAAGSDLRCYLKWLSPDDHLYEKSALDLQMEPMSNIFDVAYEFNGALPLYHPNHLIHYLMWGKIDLINAVLQSLYQVLKRIVDDEHVLVGGIPPLSISAVLKLQDEEESSNIRSQQYDALFDEEQAIQDDDEDDTRPLAASETQYLTECLKSHQLPSLSENERMHLLAMIDTFVEISHQRESLDENGARFTALIENHYHLKAILPPEDYRNELMPQDFVWALHSQSQDLLLERCIRLCGGKLLWKDARELGIFLWLQKQDAVIEQMTSIARNTYLSKEVKDPIDCTLYYLALRKKTILQTLWRSATHHKEQGAMLRFLANDFSQPRWQTAAAKNAFALLGKQRYEYAAAFFLLADRLKDSVNVILKNLKDYQLAIAVCRVYDGDSSPLLKEILRNTVLPQAIENKDRWLISISYWLLDDLEESIRSLIVPLSDITNASHGVSDSAASVTDPNLFILYEDLKRKGLYHKQKNIKLDVKLEYTFSLNVSRAYQKLGCPMLALYILKRYKPKRAIMNGVTNGIGAENTDLLAEMNEAPKEHRAADLFADEPQVHRAADLFAEEPTQTHRAADLFADTPGQTHRALDIFADEPEVSRSADLFAHSSDIGKGSDLFANESLFSEKEPTHLSEAEPVEEDKSLAVFKGLSVIRLLQTVFHTASAIYDSALVNDNFYRDTVTKRKQDLISLGESMQIPRATMEKLMMEKSIEADIFGLYLRIEPAADDQDNLFWTAFKNGCFQVFNMALSHQEFNFSSLVFIENWAERVLTTFNLWSPVCERNGCSLESQELLLYAYISLLLVVLKQRHLEKSWNLLANLRAFLDSLTSLKDIEEIVRKAVSSEAKMQTNLDSDEFEAFSDDDSLFGYNMEEEVYRPHLDFKDKAPGSQLLENASLHYALSQLEGYMQSSEKRTTLSTELVQFIWTFILDAIAYRAYKLKVTCMHDLGEEIDGRMVVKQFKTLRQKKYWRSLKTLRVPERLLPFVNFSPPEINILASDETEQQQPQLIYSTPTTVHAFAINSDCPDTVAVCMKTEIQEIDLTSARPYGPPPTGYSDNHVQAKSYYQNSDSYPDTEEEDETRLSDAETEASGHTSKHSLLHHHKNHQHLYAHVHGKTPLETSPASGRIHPEEHSKGQQNSNIDTLHESLRRSLGIRKEGSLTSDSSRSPAAASSADSMAEMVTLKRSISATCAEAHPHFPFYITGCEIPNNNSPSAILWQYGQEREIAKYYGCRGKATRIHFEPFGQKFGAGDTNGGLAFWRFDSHAHSDRPYYTLQSCHSKATRDFAFLDSSSVVGTAGTSNAMSRKKDHVCVWDTLLPPSKAMIFSLFAHDSGAYAIAYNSNNKLLFTAGKRGEIAISDLRQRAVMHTFSAHQSRIRSISIDPEHNMFVTGSVDGELKIWDLSTYKQQASYDTQPRNRFLGAGFQAFPLKAYGVTQIQIVENCLYSAGPAGIVRCNIGRSSSLI